MSLYINPSVGNMAGYIDDPLEPLPGYCCLIDIVGSTQLKDGPAHVWIPKILATFANVRAFLDVPPLKSIGDELMYYISQEEIDSFGGPLGLLALLKGVAQDADPIFAEVKIGTAHCLEAFDITFVENTEDVYGKDIDLTARLLGLAAAREIVMNARLAEAAKKQFQSIGSAEEFSFMQHLRGPKAEVLKGFAAPVSIYRLRCPAGDL